MVEGLACSSDESQRLTYRVWLITGDSARVFVVGAENLGLDSVGIMAAERSHLYVCPAYYYPIRKGNVMRDSFMMNIDHKLGESPSEHWIKRGTALLMSIGV